MANNFWKNGQGINLGHQASDPSSPQSGDFYYNTVSNTVRLYNGTVWTSIGGGSFTIASQTISGAGQTLTTTTFDGFQLIVATANGSQTLSATPFGTTAPNDGTVIRIVQAGGAATLTVLNNDAAKGALLNGNAVMYVGDMLEVQYVLAFDRYIEVSRNF